MVTSREVVLIAAGAGLALTLGVTQFGRGRANAAPPSKATEAPFQMRFECVAQVGQEFCESSR
jgi:hypothetical protein